MAMWVRVILAFAEILIFRYTDFTQMMYTNICVDITKY